MQRLKILPDDRSLESRVKLFETVAARVLNHLGYRLDRIRDSRRSTLNFEITGLHTRTAGTLYAEFTYAESPITDHHVQAFYGRYMARWLADKRCRGVLVALPGADHEAKEFYREYILNHAETSARLLDGDEVIKIILDDPKIVRSDFIARRVPMDVGRVEEADLLYTEKGLFWLLFFGVPGEAPSRRAALFDARGNATTDPAALDYLAGVFPELENFDILPVSCVSALQPGLFQTGEEVVETTFGPEPFDAFLPASPERFIDSRATLDRFEAFAEKVIKKETPDRVLTVEGFSGSGKSSLLLALADRFGDRGHFAATLDARSASSPDFVDRALNRAIQSAEGRQDQSRRTGSAKAQTDPSYIFDRLTALGKDLEARGRLCFLLFDQFEAVFPQKEIFERFGELFLKIREAQTNIIAGFAWRSEALRAADDSVNEAVRSLSRSGETIVLDFFRRQETNLLFQRLRKELGEPPGKNLQFVITEFAQGHPRLLNTLCGHVLKLRQAGLSQPDIAKRRLNFHVLFEQDLSALPDAESEALRAIAAASPVRIPHAVQVHDVEIVNSLVQRGLVVRTGNAYDIGLRRFRDFLVTGRVPARDRYLLLSNVDDVFVAAKSLAKTGTPPDVLELQIESALKSRPYHLALRDMELLALAEVVDDTVVPVARLAPEPKKFESSWRAHVRERLKAHPAVPGFLKSLEDHRSLNMEEAAAELKKLFPFVFAQKRIWRSCARIFSSWLDAADLAFLDKKSQRLAYLDPASEVRERYLVLPKRRGAKIPKIQFSPIESVAARIVQALERGGGTDWTGLKKSTIFSALAILEDLGFIRRRPQVIKVLPKGMDFVLNPGRRSEIFAASAMQMPLFSTFIDIINTHRKKEKTLMDLGLELKEELGTGWKPSTAETVAKILLDWSRHAKLAPGVFGRTRKGPIKGRRKKEGFQMPLFSDMA